MAPKIKSKFISIEGNIGAGKTTILKMILQDIIKKEFTLPLIHKVMLEPVQQYQNYDGYYGKFNPLKLMYENPSNIPITQLHIMKESQKYFSKDLSYESRNILAERSFLATYVFIKAYLDSGKIPIFVADFLFKLWSTMLTSAIKPNAIIFIDQSPEICLRNIRQRNRSNESEVLDLTFLENLDKNFKEWLSSLEKEFKIPIIRVNVSKDQTLSELKKDVILAIQCAFTQILANEVKELVAETHNVPPGFEISYSKVKNVFIL